MSSKLQAYSIVQEHAITNGVFGRFYRGVITATGKSAAIKIIEIPDTDDERYKIKELIERLTDCSTTNVAEYFGVEENVLSIWITRQYFPLGSALDLLQSGPFTTSHIATILCETVKGLCYLHGKGIIHESVKASNILFTDKGEIKLADYGVASTISRLMGKCKKIGAVTTATYWLAPEIIMHSPHTVKSDVWSLGITAIELVHGEPPMSDVSAVTAIYTIPQSDPPRLSNDYATELVAFVEACLKKSPQDRPTADDLQRMVLLMNSTDITSIHDILDRQRQHVIRAGVAVAVEKQKPEVPPRPLKKKTYTIPASDQGVSAGLQVPAGLVQERIRMLDGGDSKARSSEGRDSWGVTNQALSCPPVAPGDAAECEKNVQEVYERYDSMSPSGRNQDRRQ